MENSAEMETRKSPPNILSFPPHRRRPLRSRTYCSLLKLLSHCDKDLQHSPSLQPVPQAQTSGVNGAVEFSQGTEHNELTQHGEMNSINLLVQQEPAVDKDRESINLPSGIFSAKQKDIQELIFTNVTTEVNGQVAQANSIFHGGSTVNKQQTGDCTVMTIDELENVNRVPEQVARGNNIAQVGSVIDKDQTSDGAIKNVDKLENTVGVQERVAPENCMIQRDPIIDKAQTSDCAIKSVDELANVGEHAALANNIIHRDSVMDKAQTSDCTIKTVDELGNSNVPGFQIEDVGPYREPDSKKGLCAGEVFEATNSRIGLNVTSESPKFGKNCEKEASGLDRSMSKEVEYQLRLKEIELENLISNSSPVDISHYETANEEIEEGEISGEPGVYDDLMDELFEDSLLSERRTAEEVQVSGVDKEVFAWDDELFQRGVESDCLLNAGMGDSNDPMEVDIVRKKQDCESQTSVHNSATNSQRVDSTEVIKETPAACGKTIPENNVDKNVDKQVHVSAQQTADGKTSRKKRGPMTEEKKEKKRKKKRIKRAETNRKLGVKRLKLQPVTKPKTITYCRHYLKGRCQEGEKCKFSHDTVPLTKSKPCCHFARHTCMKGDDCPFDHQLSKYPCNNFTTQGFCSRGSECLFSHKMPTSGSASPASNVSKPELKSQQQMTPSTKGSFTTPSATKLEAKAPPVMTNLTPSNHSNIQNGVSKFSSMKTPGKNVDPHSNPSQRTAAQAPKGVNFLFCGKSLLGDSSKHKQAGSSLKADLGNNVGCDPNMSSSVKKSNETAKSVPPRKPQGINFLSFGNVSSDDSSHKTLSSLFSSKINEIEKSIFVDSTKGEQARKGPLDDSSIKNQAGLGPNNGNIASPLVQEKEVTSDRLQLPSSNPFALSMEQSSAGCSTSTPSSLKTSVLLNTPSSVQKAVQSTLAFAAKFDTGIRLTR